MTQWEAVKAAQRLAKAKQQALYVVHEDGWHVATEFDLDTFFAGTNPVYGFDSTGEPIW